jgi:acyl carrier protein
MATAATDVQELENTVFDHLATLGPERSDIRTDATLEQLDVDSLDVVELAQMVEGDVGVEIDPERFVGSKTAGDLLQTIVTIVRESAEPA